MKIQRYLVALVAVSFSFGISMICDAFVISSGTGGIAVQTIYPNPTPSLASSSPSSHVCPNQNSIIHDRRNHPNSIHAPPGNRRRGMPTTRTATQLQAAMMGAMVSSAAIFALRGGRSANLAIVASGGAGDVAEILISAYEWCINLGNPSALVAGAVIATIYENMSSGAMDVEASDRKWVKFGKRMTRVLLLSAFALEVMSIFVTTVTGTMLLSRTLDYMDEIVPVTEDTTPLEFLRNNFEFEYLTARITFLQGLLNWIAAIALEHIVPSGDERNKNARTMNKFIGGALFSSLFIMVSFYNKHMTFYQNYGHMLTRWFAVLLKQFVFYFPLQPMAFFYIPSIVSTTYFGVKAFFTDSKNDENFEDSPSDDGKEENDDGKEESD